MKRLFKPKSTDPISPPQTESPAERRKVDSLDTISFTFHPPLSIVDPESDEDNCRDLADNIYGSFARKPVVLYKSIRAPLNVPSCIVEHCGTAATELHADKVRKFTEQSELLNALSQPHNPSAERGKAETELYGDKVHKFIEHTGHLNVFSQSHHSDRENELHAQNFNTEQVQTELLNISLHSQHSDKITTEHFHAPNFNTEQVQPELLKIQHAKEQNHSELCNDNVQKFAEQTELLNNKVQQLVQMNDSAEELHKDKLEDESVIRPAQVILDSPLSKKSMSEDDLKICVEPVEEDLGKVPWYHAGLSREIAGEVLADQPEGSFLIRESLTKSGCLALTVRVPPDPHGGPCVRHYLILQTPRGRYKIKGFTKEFSTLMSLVSHHAVMQELLPVPLNLPPRSPCSDRQNIFCSLEELSSALQE